MTLCVLAFVVLVDIIGVCVCFVDFLRSRGGRLRENCMLCVGAVYILRNYFATINVIYSLVSNVDGKDAMNYLRYGKDNFVHKMYIYFLHMNAWELVIYMYILPASLRSVPRHTTQITSSAVACRATKCLGM